MPNFTVIITDADADRDGQAAKMIVDQENARRTALNEGDNPPNPELDMLPTTPAGALKTSYETVLGEQILAGAHESYIKQAAAKAEAELMRDERWAIASDAERQASVDALPPLN